jgi:hypothetical protein
MGWCVSGRFAVRQAVPLVLGAVTLFAALGCGESSKTSLSGRTDSATAPSASDSPAASRLIAEADVICRRLNNALAASKSAGKNASQIVSASSRHAALERRTVAELNELTAPTSLTRDWKQIISFRRTLADDLIKLAHLAKVENSTAIRSLAASKTRVHDELTRIATRDGFKDCSTFSTGTGGSLAFPILPRRRRTSKHR